MKRHNDDSEALIPQDPFEKLTSKQKRQLNINVAVQLIGDTLFISLFCLFCYHLPPIYPTTSGSSVQSDPASEFSNLHFIVVSIGLFLRLFFFSLTVYITYEINNGSFGAAKRAHYLSFVLYFKAIGPLVSDILIVPGLSRLTGQNSVYPSSAFFLFSFELLYYILSPMACSIEILLHEFLLSDEERAEREARFDPVKEILFQRALRGVGLL